MVLIWHGGLHDHGMYMTRDDPRERLHFYRTPALPGVELMAAYDSFQPWHVYHERYDLCACRMAAAGWRYRHGEYFLNDQSTALMEPGEFHRNTTVYKRSDFKVLFLSPEFLLRAAAELGIKGTPHFKIAQVEANPLFGTVYDFAAAMEGSAGLLEQQTKLDACVQTLLTYSEQPPLLPGRVKPPAIERAKSYLREHLAANISLDELAGVARLNRFHLVHAFKRHVGISPHAYQNHIRVERARTLLLSGVRPADVATQLGYADQSHFIRHFCRIWNLTPKQYVLGRRVSRRNPGQSGH